MATQHFYGIYRIPVEARYTTEVQNGPEPTQPPYTVGNRSLPGVKRPGRGVDHPPLSGAQVKETELHLYSPCGGFVACSRVDFTFTFTLLCLCHISLIVQESQFDGLCGLR